MRQRTTFAIVATILSIAMASEGMADQESAPMRLTEIVVTAQKRDERLSEVPISIAVLTGNTLDADTNDTLNDAISQVAGVYSFENGQNGGTKFAIRGVTSNGSLFDGSSTVGYYLDEVPFGFAKIPVLPDASAYDLERVEVLRGPQGTLYGANALNGVIRIVTKDANLDEFEFKGRGSVSGTEDGGENYRADAALNIPLIPGKFAVRAVLGYGDLSGWIDQPATGKSDVNDAELKVLRVKANADLAENTDMELLAWLNRDDRGGPSMSADGSTTPSTQDEPISTDYDIYGLVIGHEFSSVSLVSATNYMDYQNIGILDIAGFDRLNTTIEAELFSQEFRLTSTNTGAWRWSAGAIYRDAEDRVFAELPILIGPPEDHRYGSQSYAVFGELTRILGGGSFELTAGLRYFEDRTTVEEHSRLGVGEVPDPIDSQETFSAVTPRVVFAWHPDENRNVYVSYSEGFRSGFGLDSGVITNFPDAQPVREDTLNNFEIGTKGTILDGRLSYDVAAFYIDWQDTQQQLFFEVIPPGGVFGTVPLNGEDIEGVGFDVAVAVAVTDALNFSLSAGWNDLGFAADVVSGGVVIFNEGDRPDESPSTTIRGDIDYTVPFGGGGLEARFAAAANYASEVTSHSFGTGLVAYGDDFFNGQLEISLLSPNGWVATVYADNVADENPVIRPLAASPDFSTRVRPRTIGFQFEYQF